MTVAQGLPAAAAGRMFGDKKKAHKQCFAVTKQLSPTRELKRLISLPGFDADQTSPIEGGILGC